MSEIDQIKQRLEDALSTIQPEPHWDDIAYLIGEVERLERNEERYTNSLLPETLKNGFYLELQTKNQTLKQALSVAREALGFYADRDHWTRARDTSCSQMTGPDDHDFSKPHDCFHAGRQARLGITKLNELLGDAGS